MSEHYHFASAELLRRALVEEVCARLKSALQQRSRARLIVSGGNTPLPLFRKLRDIDLPWGRVEMTGAAERLVPTDHKRSNEGLVRAELLQSAATAATFVPLQQLPQLWRDDPLADVCLLGMGGDGHTASLFPDAPELDLALSADAPLLQEMNPPSQPEPRLTLTLLALQRCEQLLLHIQGQDKLDVLQRAQEEGSVTELPVRALLRQTRTALAIYWAP